LGGTGQRPEAEIGLYFYNARFYDAKLGRFAQADTIVPGAGNVLALDRYAYVKNNSLRYTDPSGHFSEDEMCEYWGYCGDNAEERAKEELGALHHVMWDTPITWGDIAFIENESGDISTIMFMLFTMKNPKGPGGNIFWGGFWDVNKGDKIDAHKFAPAVDAIGYHTTWIGTISTADSSEWLSNRGLEMPDINGTKGLLDNSENFNLGVYVDFGGWWWTEVTVGTVGWFVDPRVGFVGSVLAFAGAVSDVTGWASDSFGWDILQKPIDAKYPLATYYDPNYCPYCSSSQGTEYWAFNPPKGMHK